MEQNLPFRILYEDNHLLVVEKPANIPVQADASGDPDLLTMCKQYIKKAYNKPGDAYLGLVHRLDRPVGGVMVFARTSKAATRLTDQFSSHRAKKRYAAIVRGCPSADRKLTDYLLKDEKSFTSRVVDASTPGAKKAELRYSILAKRQDCALLDVCLYTGRPHQIRVQLSHMGHPIIGDQRYGIAENGNRQIRLWAYALTITHPTLGEEMTFFSSPITPGETNPEDGFQAFAAETELLPAFSACRGVYMDDSLLVVDKEAGTEVTEDLLPTLESIVGPIYPVHRLDANTMGLIAFARTAEMEQQLSNSFRTHENVSKEYLAILCGTPVQKEGRLTNSLLKDADGSTVHIVPAGTSGGRTAVLDYRVLRSTGNFSLVSIQLLTGRTHQIRVQMAGIGCPVLGDDKYGFREINKAQHCHTQQLLAKRLHISEKHFESLRELVLPDDK